MTEAQAPVTPPAPKPMGKLRASYLLAVESFEFVRKDPEIIWYTAISALVQVVLIALFVAGTIWYYMMFTTVDLAADVQPEPTLVEDIVMYGSMFVYYILAFFVLVYFQAALTTVVKGRIDGKNLSFGDGIKNANRNIGRFFLWSLFASTVGVILRFISEKFGWVGALFGFAGDVAWSLVNFFIVPVLTLEDRSIGDSIKRSGGILKQTWGEALIMNVGLGAFFLGLYLLVIVLMVVTVFLGMANLWIMTIGLVSMTLLLVILMVVQSTLEAVFKVVLYEYAANGKVAESFTPELIIGAMKRKGT